MLSYSFKCRKTSESKFPKVVKIKNNRIMLLSKSTMGCSKKPTFIEEQEATG